MRVKDGLGVRGMATFSIFDSERIQEAYPRWKHFPRDFKLKILSSDLRLVDPIEKWTTENDILDNYLRALANEDGPSPEYLAIGSGVDSVDLSANSLHNEEVRIPVGQSEVDGFDRIASILVSQNEANGVSINEIGFASGPSTDPSTELLTHLVLDPSERIGEKSSNQTVTINYVIQFTRT